LVNQYSRGITLPEERVERRLAAVLAADVAGYSRLMGMDEEGTLALLKHARKAIIDPSIASHRGRIVKTTGDGMLVEFASAVDAARCAADVQRAMADQNAGVPQDRRVEFRIGIHVGDIIFDDNDIFGDGVNIAARLEGISDAGGVCISDDAYRQIRGKVEIVLDDFGSQTLRNIAEPMRVWRVRIDATGSVASVQTPPVERRTPALPDKPSIAVLPFKNMSGDAEQEHFADGVVEDIITGLSRSRSLFVIARNSTFTYKGKAVDIKQVGRDLGVRYVLEGSVRKAGNRIRITGQLIEASTGNHVWADRFDTELADIFDLQDLITSSVVGAIYPSIRSAEIERSRRKRPQDLNAYDYAMRAMPHVWALEKDETAKALQLLEEAIALDQQYPLALSLAGWCHAQRSVYNWASNTAESQALALALAERAVELNGDDSLVLAVLGAVHTFVRNYGTARVLLERAIAMDPSAAWAWSRLGWLENYTDRPERALENFERALRLSPLDPMNFNNYVGMGSACEISEDYDKAVLLYSRALDERPHAVWIYRNLVSSLAGAGRIEDAKKAYNHVLGGYPDLTITSFKRAMVFSSSALDRMAENLRKIGMPE
jgi:adenylate cyclase